jgi:NAD(P)-dependent dehydrogenase (short-subunit alcohol dehydrogenase family)
MNAGACTALVTGGASGLGLATVERLVEAGANVVLFDLPGAAGEDAAERLRERVAFVPGDVVSESDTRRAVDTAVERFGAVHVNVNCAGIAPGARVVDRDAVPMDLELFRRAVDVNLLGTFNSLRLCAAQMARQEPVGSERGVIVMTASTSAFEGQVGQSAYAASKGGVVGLTLAAARDLAPHAIRVVSIAPGLFDTGLARTLPERQWERMLDQVAFPKRAGRPKEFARLVVDIIENEMFNGETVRLDAGIRMPIR